MIWPFTRRKPAPKRCTDENVNELLGRIISHENNSRDQPETLDETRIRDMMPDRFYRAQGEQE